MKTTSLALASAATALVLGVSGSAHATEWTLDPSHTAAQFSVKHMKISTVRGQFDKLTGTVNLDDKDLTKSTVNVTIDANSINTREPKRDAHLRSPDFFEVAKYPTLTFQSTKVEKAGDKLLVTGDLTIRGISKPVVLTVEGPSPAVKNPWGVPVRVISATGKLNRLDYGLKWNKALEAGGFLVGDEITLIIDGELQPKQPETAAKK